METEDLDREYELFYISVLGEADLHDFIGPRLMMLAFSAEQAKETFERCLQRKVEVFGSDENGEILPGKLA